MLLKNKAHTWRFAEYMYMRYVTGMPYMQSE